MQHSEVIPNKVAARILGMSKQYMFDEMAAGRLDIGWMKPRGKKAASHGSFKVYRGKLALFLNKPSDYVWPEELDGETA